MKNSQKKITNRVTEQLTLSLKKIETKRLELKNFPAKDFFSVLKVSLLLQPRLSTLFVCCSCRDLSTICAKTI